MFQFSGPKACGILAPQSGIKPPPPTLEGEVLITGPPGKSLKYFDWMLVKHLAQCLSHDKPKMDGNGYYFY